MDAAGRNCRCCRWPCSRGRRRGRLVCQPDAGEVRQQRQRRQGAAALPDRGRLRHRPPTGSSARPRARSERASRPARIAAGERRATRYEQRLVRPRQRRRRPSRAAACASAPPGRRPRGRRPRQCPTAWPSPPPTRRPRSRRSSPRATRSPASRTTTAAATAPGDDTRLRLLGLGVLRAARRRPARLAAGLRRRS